MTSEDYDVLQEFYFKQFYDLIATIIQGNVRIKESESNNTINSSNNSITNNSFNDSIHESLKELSFRIFSNQIDNILRFLKSNYSKDETKRSCLIMLASFCKYFSERIFEYLNVQWDILLPTPKSIINEFTILILELLKFSTNSIIIDQILSNKNLFSKLNFISSDVCSNLKSKF